MLRTESIYTFREMLTEYSDYFYEEHKPRSFKISPLKGRKWIFVYYVCI